MGGASGLSLTPVLVESEVGVAQECEHDCACVCVDKDLPG